MFRRLLLAVSVGLALAFAGCAVLPATFDAPDRGASGSDPAPGSSARPVVPASSPTSRPSPTAELTPSRPPRPQAAKSTEAKGPAEFVNHVDTEKKIAFLTIDDGAVTDPRLLAYLTAKKVPITTFLTTQYAEDHWAYWKQMDALGSIQNHTRTHPTLTTLGRGGSVEQICGANERIAAGVGATPWMLRPPYGTYGDSTLAAAGDCGLDYVVHWTVSLPDEEIQFQVGDKFRPGDIILTHYRADLIPHLDILLARLKQEGFTLARLEDYLPPKS